MTMRAVVKVEASPGFRLDRIPIPKPAAGEVLVRVKATAICGTDLHIADWSGWAQQAGIRLPLIMGHEFAGEVVEAAPGVREVRAGDYVAGETHVPCGECYQCRNGLQHICGRLTLFGIHRDGSFAEYAVLPAICARKIPTAIPPRIGAILEPLGTALRAVMEVDIPGETVAVVGCGPIGLFAVAAARALGAGRIVALDVVPGRLALARRLGADLALDARDGDVVQVIREATSGVGVDAIVEASGSVRAIPQAFDFLRKGGKVALIGLPSDPVALNLGPQVIFKEARVYGIHGRMMFETWTRMENLLASRILRVDPVITHEMALEEVAEGFALLARGEGSKVILTP